MLDFTGTTIEIPFDLPKGGKMGKSLKGKELGKGITQRKDGLYQARFINRFGKRQTIYAKEDLT